MPIGVRINYDEIANSSMRHHLELESAIREMKSSYSQVMYSLQELDSSTNLAVQEAIEHNAQKAVSVVDLLHKILLIIENSSIQIEQQERQIASSFNNENGGT